MTQLGSNAFKRLCFIRHFSCWQAPWWEKFLLKISLFAHTIIKLIFYSTYSFWRKKHVLGCPVLSHLKTKLTQKKSNWDIFICINIIKCKKKNNNNKQKKQTKTKKQEWSQLDFFWIKFGFKFDKAAQVTTISSIWSCIITGIALSTWILR